ncbi:MAG: hypothetical protein HY328_12535 [Chloroflexi bacterium]|nr:hypothetical protein [Chloroflexota bacterium]
MPVRCAQHHQMGRCAYVQPVLVQPQQPGRGRCDHRQHSLHLAVPGKAPVVGHKLRHFQQGALPALPKSFHKPSLATARHRIVTVGRCGCD